MNIGLLDIRPIESKEWDEAIDFVWRIFRSCNETNMPPEGKNSFSRFVHDERLRGLYNSGYFRVYIIKLHEEIKGVVATKDYNHISLLFVEEEDQRRGIGSLLVKYIEILALNNGVNQMTVNAAAGAEGFYKKNGYISAGLSHVEDGVRSTPMVKFL